MARKTWIGILSDFVRKNPRTSAMIAFNLGVWAAQATRKGLRNVDVSDLPAKVADLLPSMPSMKDIGSYMPSLPSPKTRVTVKVTRRGPRKSSAPSQTARSRRRRSSKGEAKSHGKRRAA
jgi:hypothetical protein